jgi:hypothetical protein
VSDLRPSPAILSQPPREINTTAPPHTHTLLRTHNTQAHTSTCTRRGTRARARRSLPAINFVTHLFEPKDTNLHLHRTHHTHVTACHTSRSPLPLQRPCPS